MDQDKLTDRLAPPKEKDIERSRLRDIMDKKVVVWDHMMNTEVEDERKAGLEAFKRLGDDEMAMAKRNLSKSKLKELIDLKIHYFDQLANAREEENRKEGLRRFRKVGDDELHLAKMMGPSDKLDDIVKAREEKDRVKRMESARKQQLPKVTVSMTDPYMTPQMLARQQLMHIAELEKKATENIAQTAHGIPMQPQQETTAQQQQQMMAQAMMPPPMPPMPPSILPPPGFYPPNFSQFQTIMPGPAMYGNMLPQFSQYAELQPQTPNTAVALDMENKLRLLSQLEATRQAIQSQPVGPRTSIADEIKQNLRRLNNLKMKLIDEILGGKPAEAQFDIMNFPPKQMTAKSRKDRKIVVELVGPGGPDYEPVTARSEPPAGMRWNKQPQPDDRYSVTAQSDTYIDAVPQPVCPTHTCPAYQHCLAHSGRQTPSETCLDQLQMVFKRPPSDNLKPEVIWERPEVKMYVEKSTMIDHADALKYINADQPVVREVYKRSLTEIGTSPPGFQMMQPNYVTLLPMSILGERQAYGETRMRPQHDIGIIANPYEDDPRFASRGTTLPSRTGPVISKTTVVVNQPPKEPTTQPKPAPQIKVVTIPETVQMAAPVRTSSVSDGNRAIHESIERLARSVDDMFDTLTSRTRSQSRTRRRPRTFDDDDDDEYEDYESRQTPRYGRRRRSSRRRSRDGGDGYDEDDLDGWDDISYKVRSPRSGYSRPRSRMRTSDEDDLPSLWEWLCRSLCNLTDVPRSRSDVRDTRFMQMGSRIGTLIESVIRVSREVIEARRAIQQSGLRGEDYVNGIFQAENKLWELIDLEAQLANELAYYRQSDLASDNPYFQGLVQAENKIRRLIAVETQLAREIGSWRKQSAAQNRPQSKSTIYTTLSRLPSLPCFPALPAGLRPSTTAYGSTLPATTSVSTVTSPSTTSQSTTPTASATTAAGGSGSTTPSTTTKESKKPKKKKKSKKKKSKSKKSGSKKKKKKSSKSSKKKRKKVKSKSGKSKKKKKRKKKKKK
ncbi:uncharacterized protein LOC115325258 [Ixodes scapularis]|uniref:uncharacterized protein LOC115325258 n=1 Tax=Ixodes scapularis TaxID=6945 RepID=UPI001C38679D|nr:uncharacterized protein LOC115325258 [Ixodes scapularis]